MFSVHTTTHEVERFSRLNGLSETGVRTIAFDSIQKKLVIAYQNSNIDILGSNSIVNVPGLKRKNIPGDKTIYRILPSKDYCYLATGIGIVVLDLARNEIRDTWVIGSGGRSVPVWMVARDSRFFYAATAEGLKKAGAAANPADYRSWQNVPGFEETREVITLQDRLYALRHDSVFLQTDAGWQLFYARGNAIRFIMATEGHVAIGEAGPAVSFVQPSGNVSATLRNHPSLRQPAAALKKGTDYWISDSLRGLSRWTGNDVTGYALNSPLDAATGAMQFYGNTLRVAAGSVDASWNGGNNYNGVFIFSDNRWTNYSAASHPVLDSMPDFVTVAADPRDGSTWAGSFGGGLLHIRENGFRVYKQSSPIRPGRGGYRVSGLAFDSANHLWIANYGAMENLHVLQNNGSWQSFVIPFALVENAVSQIVIDDANQKWIVSPKGNGLICFNHGSSIQNAADDRWLRYQAGVAGGNLPSSNVLSIAKDRDGAIWVGTDDGIAVIPCPWEVHASGCAAVLPVVKDGNFSNYLFKGEAVNSIAVDGANRKWIGTANGAWLISPSGDKVLAHFTEENSPLLGNDVNKIAINGNDGEVFFATAKGILSFRGTATEPAINQEQMLVFPNPVPPGYTGSIAVKGLAANTFIKITEPNGRLVFQARALGGQVVWNGRDYNGRKIASGVYLVLATNENKTERKVGRIVFISGK